MLILSRIGLSTDHPCNTISHMHIHYMYGPKHHDPTAIAFHILLGTNGVQHSNQMVHYLTPQLHRQNKYPNIIVWQKIQRACVIQLMLNTFKVILACFNCSIVFTS